MRLKVLLIPLLIIALWWGKDLIQAFQLIFYMQGVIGFHWKIVLAYGIIILPLVGSVTSIILILRHFSKKGDYLLFKSSWGKLLSKEEARRKLDELQ